jgi:hypothetical protein
VSINGFSEAAAVSPHGYLEIAREWQAGDQITLTLPMPPRLTVTHPAVDAVRGTVAIERGPVVYCFESPDQPEGVDLNHVELLTTEPLTEELHPNLLDQPVVLIHAEALTRDDTAWTTPWSTLGAEPPTPQHRVTLTALPYHLWANRGPSTMRIFIPIRR